MSIYADLERVGVTVKLENCSQHIVVDGAFKGQEYDVKHKIRVGELTLMTAAGPVVRRNVVIYLSEE